MDQIPDQPTPALSPIPPANAKAKRGYVLLLLGFCVVFVLGLGGAYYAGSHSQKPLIPTPTVSATARLSPSPKLSPTSQTFGKLVHAGMKDSQVFHEYTITVPRGWIVIHQPDIKNHIDTLTLSAEDYSLIITQAPADGGMCLFSGEAAPATAQIFNQYTDIASSTLHLRRAWTEVDKPSGSINYTICQQTPDGSYSSLTTFGRVDAKAPIPPDEALISEIDALLSSLALN